MAETIIVLAIVGAALAFAVRWIYRRMSGQATSCCSGEKAPPSCCSCDQGIGRLPGETDM